MSISAIPSSSAYASAYATNGASSRKRTGGDDPMSQAIQSLQSTDPTLASKLTDLQKKVDAMKKGGASAKDVQSAVKSTLDGLSETEQAEFKSAMPAPPAGGAPRAGGHHHPKKAASDDSDSSSASASPFAASSLLDASSSMQNDSIMSLLSARSSASAM